MHWLYNYAAVTSPDFSTYTDMSLAYQLWNVFRNHYIGAYCQQVMKLPVLFTLSWSTEESFEFCFLGVEKGTAVALNSTGIEKDKVQDLHLAGLKRAIEIIEPAVIYVYGGKKSWYPDYNYVNIPTFCQEIDRRDKAHKSRKLATNNG